MNNLMPAAKTLCALTRLFGLILRGSAGPIAIQSWLSEPLLLTLVPWQCKTITAKLSHVLNYSKLLTLVFCDSIRRLPSKV
jgi:hypothetical protein